MAWMQSLPVAAVRGVRHELPRLLTRVARAHEAGQILPTSGLVSAKYLRAAARDLKEERSSSCRVLRDLTWTPTRQVVVASAKATRLTAIGIEWAARLPVAAIGAVLGLLLLPAVGVFVWQKERQRTGSRPALGDVAQEAVATSLLMLQQEVRSVAAHLLLFGLHSVDQYLTATLGSATFLLCALALPVTYPVAKLLPKLRAPAQPLPTLPVELFRPILTFAAEDAENLRDARTVARLRGVSRMFRDEMDRLLPCFAQREVSRTVQDALFRREVQGQLSATSAHLAGVLHRAETLLLDGRATSPLVAFAPTDKSTVLRDLVQRTPQLLRLRLRHARLAQSACFRQTLMGLPALRLLDLTGINLGKLAFGDDNVALPAALTHLYLRNTNLTDNTLQRLLGQGSRSLQLLDLRDNYLAKGYVPVPNVPPLWLVGGGTQLQHWAALGIVLPAVPLARLPALTDLYLAGNFSRFAENTLLHLPRPTQQSLRRISVQELAETTMTDLLSTLPQLESVAVLRSLWSARYSFQRRYVLQQQRGASVTQQLVIETYPLGPAFLVAEALTADHATLPANYATLLRDPVAAAILDFDGVRTHQEAWSVD